MVDGIGPMFTLLKHTLEQIGRELGTRPAEVPCKYRKIIVKGLPFRVSRFVAPHICNVAVMEMNALIMKLFTIIITPFDRKAPLVCVDVIRIPGKTKYICEVYEFGGSEHASFYEDIPCAGLNVEPASGDLWYSHLRTFVKYLGKTPFHGDRRQYEHFVREFIGRTCGIYREAIPLGAPGDGARDCQIRQVRAYAHGLIEKGGACTDLFKAAMGPEQLADFYDTVLFRAEE